MCGGTDAVNGFAKHERPLEAALFTLACQESVRAISRIEDDYEALDRCLDRLREWLGEDVLCSVFVREHGRLWVVSQRGYSAIPDGLAPDEGIVGRALCRARVQLVSDVRSDPDYLQAHASVISELAAPLVNGNTVVGVLNIESKVPLPAEAGEVSALLAHRLALRVQAIRAEPALDLPALTRLFLHSSSLREVRAIAELAARSVGRLLALECVQLNLLSAVDRSEPAGFWRRGGSVARPVSTQLLDRIEESEKPTGVVSMLRLDRSMQEAIGELGTASIVWIPLRARGEAIGLLAGRATDAVSIAREQAEVAALVAAHAAASIYAAEALERERMHAVTDPLTGLLNLRGFEKRFQEELQRAQRLRRPLALALLDCDNFKAINDSGGHACGDEVLRRVGRVLARELRACEVAARLGGDEFALLLPDATLPEAKAAVERIRSSLQQDLALARHALTVSAGVTVSPEHGAKAAQLLREADVAMYQAKMTRKTMSRSRVKPPINGRRPRRST